MEEFAKPILDLFCSCFGQELGNRVELDENVSTLAREMALLRTTREQVQERVDLAEGRLQLARTPEVDRWLVSVDNLDRDVAQIQSEFQSGGDPLLHWWHGPRRWWGRYRLSSRVATQLQELHYLKRHGEFKVVAERPRPAPAFLLYRRVDDVNSGSRQ